MTAEQFRIGSGYDVHRLGPDRALVIGGVTIDWPLGLVGHSDADVLLHAICDALLGAAGLGDIGQHFPPSDERYAGMDSREFLREVSGLLIVSGFETVNVDATIIAEKPKMAPLIPQMVDNIAGDLGVDRSRINVKATTTEGLGFCGREEGMAAMASVLLVARSRPA